MCFDPAVASLSKHEDSWQSMYWYTMLVSYNVVQRLTCLLLAIDKMFEFNSLSWRWFRFVKLLFYSIESLLRGCTGKLNWCNWSTLLPIHFSGILEENWHSQNAFIWQLQSWGTFLWILPCQICSVTGFIFPVLKWLNHSFPLVWFSLVNTNSEGTSVLIAHLYLHYEMWMERLILTDSKLGCPTVSDWNYVLLWLPSQVLSSANSFQCNLQTTVLNLLGDLLLPSFSSCWLLSSVCSAVGDI